MHLGSQRPITFLGWIGFSIIVHFGLTCALLHPLPQKQAQCPLELGRCSIEASLQPRSKPCPLANPQAALLSEEPAPFESIIEKAMPPQPEGFAEQLLETPLVLEEKKNSETLKEALSEVTPEDLSVELIESEDSSSNVNSRIEDGAQGPIIAASVIKNPAPRYPEAARSAGQEGSVELKINLDAKGKVINVTVAKTSGFKMLDDRALETVAKKWRFSPATRGSIPISSEVILLVHFHLE